MSAAARTPCPDWPERDDDPLIVRPETLLHSPRRRATCMAARKTRGTNKAARPKGKS